MLWFSKASRDFSYCFLIVEETGPRAVSLLGVQQSATEREVPEVEEYDDTPRFAETCDGSVPPIDKKWQKRKETATVEKCLSPPPRLCDGVCAAADLHLNKELVQIDGLLVDARQLE